MLTREAILGADDLPRELVSVPEWGGDVYVRVMTGKERDAFEVANVKFGKTKKDSPTPNLTNYRARLAAMVCCDENGKRLFSDEDATLLGTKSASALERITDVAHRLNGMTDAAVEGAEKNSTTVPN